ncbi:MAG: hypothetical protein A3I05_04500 [Deltaproteobacteria bacterium RIFCSPLOWO2_02_FULL_44_10]|nr:MAG: hypothetical protein A3C46_07305 [Deltaproteobacteria bacterium RIFCSPHIGHO2_02_FULL_44_16]OGQ46618.1 MAG: hypothetical protein A3I05_04500 [Deltaproteobacteria bacterium RIFCSPLOWO2_02_FULL_44_10]
MKRFIFALLMAGLLFVLLNLIYSNLDDATFGYAVSFKFSVPTLFAYRSAPIPLGFVLLIAFCAGMVALPLLEALPSLYKTLELRSKNKKIRQLEKELSVVRKISEQDQQVPKV